MLLSGYWFVFWVLNGLDKFFNGSMTPMTGDGLGKGVLLDSNGDRAGTLYGFEVQGWFGSNRNSKTISFLERIGIPESVSLPLLYSVGILEVILGLLFLVSLLWWITGREHHSALTALAYKSSIALFMGFCMVDILIGERIELWEHNTFLLVLLVSYGAFLFRDKLGALEATGTSRKEPVATSDS